MIEKDKSTCQTANFNWFLMGSTNDDAIHVKKTGKERMHKYNSLIVEFIIV